MTEFYVELQDAAGTCYGTTDMNDEVLYFYDLDEARMYAKGQLDDTYILARVIDADRKQVVDFFKQ